MKKLFLAIALVISLAGAVGAVSVRVANLFSWQTVGVTVLEGGLVSTTNVVGWAEYVYWDAGDPHNRQPFIRLVWSRAGVDRAFTWTAGNDTNAFVAICNSTAWETHDPDSPTFDPRWSE